MKCETVDLEVPANAEIVLEGYIDIGEMKVEGPFGDHTGFYSLEDLYPVFHVQCITHRKNPIYAATIVGKPPQEDAWMALAVERIFLPAAKMMIPELVDFHLPPEGVAHNLMIISIRKSYPGQARKVMNAIWSLGQAMFTKCIVVVDEDCDVKDLREVTLRALNNIDPERDIQFMLGPVDSLDHASRLPNFGSKMGIDATRKWSTEGFDRPWPDEVEMSDEVKERISRGGRNSDWSRVRKIRRIVRLAWGAFFLIFREEFGVTVDETGRRSRCSKKVWRRVRRQISPQRPRAENVSAIRQSAGRARTESAVRTGEP